MEAKVRKLADEKAYLQLVIRLIEQINPLPGIEDMVTGMLRSIIETIGGTNIKLFYWIEKELHYADFLGEREVLAAIDDPLVTSVCKSRAFLEQEMEKADSLLQGDRNPGAWTWVFPLTVGNKLAGIIKLENLHLPAASLRNYLHIFFSHAALILENEIRSYTRQQEEAELERYRHHLEQLVEERTRELHEREKALRRNFAELEAAHARLKQMSSQLLQSEKLASIGQLAAGVAHEINNPIGFVSSNLGTLKKYFDDLLHLIGAYTCLEAAVAPELRQQIDKAKQEADLEFLRDDVVDLLAESVEGVGRVRRIVQGLRDFSHPGEREWQSADLHAGLESALSVAWNEIKNKVEVVRDYGELPPIECLSSQINHMFLILLVNAAQSIQEHGQITLRTCCENGWIRIAISDTGCGIAAEIRKKVFDPFFTTRPVGKGTGLGLSMAYGIVTKHGGRIEVDSEPGRGSTFTIWLPVHCVAGTDEQG
jgi:signal transduction histidine kinase